MAVARNFPVLFLGHGNPMHAIKASDFTNQWEQIPGLFEKPEAIVVFSAHWYEPSSRVTARNQLPTIHDFYGFPEELYQIQYPANGHPVLAKRIHELIPEIELDTERGLDHGSWTLLKHLYPKADIPIVQISIDSRLNILQHRERATLLKGFRKERILFLCSGNIVHNLHRIDWNQKNTALSWAKEFDLTVQQAILNRDDDWLMRPTEAEIGRLSIPTWDHYLPLIYALGLQEPDDIIKFPVTGYELGAISMTGVMFTPQAFDPV